jgi:hypothetical protein
MIWALARRNSIASSRRFATTRPSGRILRLANRATSHEQSDPAPEQAFRVHAAHNTEQANVAFAPSTRVLDPVEISRKSSPRLPRGTGLNILVPVRGNKVSRRAAELALALLRRGSSMTALYVLSTVGLGAA